MSPPACSGLPGRFFPSGDAPWASRRLCLPFAGRWRRLAAEGSMSKTCTPRGAPLPRSSSPPAPLGQAGGTRGGVGRGAGTVRGTQRVEGIPRAALTGASAGEMEPEVSHPNQIRDGGGRGMAGVGGSSRPTEEGARLGCSQMTDQGVQEEHPPSSLPPPHLGSLLLHFGAPALTPQDFIGGQCRAVHGEHEPGNGHSLKGSSVLADPRRRHLQPQRPRAQREIWRGSPGRLLNG